MAEFKLERFKYNWRSNWQADTIYKRDDIVRFGGKSYVCLVGHTSDTDFYVDLNAVVPDSNPSIPAPRWILMTDSKTYVGTWAGSTVYAVGDIVTLDGTVWECIEGHTSTTFDVDVSKWTIFASHIEFKADWQVGEPYSAGAIVKYNGIVYKCITPHQAGGTLESNINDWEVYFDGVEYAGDWLPSTLYRKNDLVRYGGSLFQCIETHTSAIGALDEDKFDLLFPGFEYEGDWDAETYYNHGDVIRYGGALYYAVANNIADDPYITNNGVSPSWVKLSESYKFRGQWDPDNNYRPGDIVQRGGDLFKAVAEIGGSEPDGSSADYLDTELWEKLVPGFVWSKRYLPSTRGNFDANTVNHIVTVTDEQGSDPAGQKYVIDGDYRPVLILEPGYTYVFNQDDLTNVYFPDLTLSAPNPHPIHFSGDSINGERDGGTAFLDNVKYYLDGVEYSYIDFSDTDRYSNATTRRVHITVDENTPALLYYWCWNHALMGNEITIGEAIVDSGTWTLGKEYNVGDVVYHLGSTWSCNFAHIATDNNFPGDNGSGFVYWDIIIEAGQLAAMGKKGDLIEYNLNRTLQGDGSSFGDAPVEIGQTGQFLSVTEELDVFYRDWLGDSDVVYVAKEGQDIDGYGLDVDKPFRTVKHAAEFVLDNYDPLTPVKIKVNTGRYVEVGPISVPAGCTVMGDELRATTIVANNSLPEYSGDDYIYKTFMAAQFLTFIFDLINAQDILRTEGNRIEQNKNITAAGIDPATRCAELIEDHDQFIGFYLGDGVDGTPTVIGTNNATTNEDFLNAIEAIRLNRDFIVEELIARLRKVYPNYTFEKMRIERDIKHLLRALMYDLKYTGNYMTILHARDYKNRALGSQFDDLFYFRDVTGIRNATLEGLNGTVNPPGVFDLYQRPTGGAYCSLDPGWGPDDESVWISNRSPYLQGVTNIGTSCVGQKIDGALHNGGNKSMVSNDFTQVLSDGIGAWVLNNGRAELVSVFTYYCLIGYLADQGGVIRATNGNNSYGQYGAISDGNDPSEIPQSALVNARDNEATVKSVFAGEFTDKIFNFEFTHCGEEYSQVTADIVGAGVDAQTEFRDFRDGGLFEGRLVNPEDSGAVGGIGYGIALGNAQTTVDGSTSILLENTDQSEPGIYDGKRILIVGGEGTGQYGIVDSFNNITKVCNVVRESDGQPGWDHIIPGETLVSSFATNTQYRIEPLLQASEPPFDSSVTNSVPNARDWTDVTFGHVTQTFLSLDLDEGTGATAGFIQEAQASVNVENRGETYVVTISDAGAGYAVGDTTTILGTSLGGNTPENDLLIRVTSVSDDSTNSITGIFTSGTGAGGKWVAIAEPNYAAYSTNGTTFNEITLPFVGEWRRVQAGNNRFVAIPSTGSQIALSLDGTSWQSVTMPADVDWRDITFAKGKFWLIGQDSNDIYYSENGLIWSSNTLPNNALGDSTSSQWEKITYGGGQILILSGNDSAVARSSDGSTWSISASFPVTNPDLVSLTYGRNRFYAVDSQANYHFSFDGTNWTTGTMPSQDGSTAMNWQQVKYENGLFIAICDTGNAVIAADPTNGPTTFFATSEDGIVWDGRDLASAQLWKCVAYGREQGQDGKFVALASATQLDANNNITVGARAKIRADIDGGGFASVKIWDPGSGYDKDNLPTITVTDSEFTTAVGFETRVGNGVIAQPDWVNRGLGYRTSSTIVTLTGDGYADKFFTDNIVKLYGVANVPGPGAQLRFDKILEEDTPEPDDLKLFTAVVITDLGDDGTGNNTNIIQCQISPSFKNEYDIGHDATVSIRERYSQCRISGHDFLDIGTGNFEETNYPELYAGGAFFVAAPENEVYEENGGRVFYTSTDQDGNFRAGELFAVEQATGVVTISAQFFDLDGLSELSLGGVRLGGSGAVVREFSTDPLFTEDSNSVVPTQRAIATFLNNRLSEGGSELETNQLVAGRVSIGGELNEIDTTTGVEVALPRVSVIQGDDAHISGSLVADYLKMMDFNDTIQ